MSFNSRAFTTSTLSSRDHSKRFVKANTQEPDLNSSLGEVEDEDLFGPMTAKLRQFKKEGAEQVCILPILRPLILDHFDPNVQREYITDLESRLAAKNEENTTLSRDFTRMETMYKQAMDKHRDALGRAAKKCGMAVVSSTLSDRTTQTATLCSNPTWTILNFPRSPHR